ncbi:hypothetical protein CORC01_14175 [Colletotrichum orchidophilum]|uniref:Uncharacterized protein n=1 Tax=Colletotrichum orchidophilum TaxID=1209926 RepID=A0A1G4ANA1_9PEZI|nr:uncharacterized protein CORC01_14175 [Colletotrichum orchidophilum]OHE90523.1 hypothetical protein CORC01_14175 [Colletotrichum orchidophilum]
MANFANAQGTLDIRIDNTFKFPNQCEPSQTSSRPKYFIAFCQLEPGVAVDRSTIGRVLEVDTTGAAIRNATFILANNGTYEPDEQVEPNGVKWNIWEH